MVHFKKILVATDLSEFSLAGLSAALSLGVVYAARIVVVIVVERRPIFPPHENVAEVPPLEIKDEMKALVEFFNAHFEPRASVSFTVRAGNASEEIVRAALEERADLVVLATHGRTGLGHILLGSVAEKVVRTSSVPVLTVKPQQVRESFVRHEDIESDLHIA